MSLVKKNWHQDVMAALELAHNRQNFRELSSCVFYANGVEQGDKRSVEKSIVQNVEG